MSNEEFLKRRVTIYQVAKESGYSLATVSRVINNKDNVTEETKRKINETIEKISGFSLFNGDYITAGGLAKKSFLKFCFYKNKTSENLKLFKQFFPMTPTKDREFRKYKLYQGGKCLVSPYKIGTIQKNIYKYDINGEKTPNKITCDDTSIYIII